MKKLERENSLIILEYKFIFEERIQIEKEYIEGATDLNFRLSFFQKRIPKTKFKNENITERQKFENIFFNNSSQETAISVLEDKELTKTTEKIKEEYKWAKNLYKKIVLITHPDRQNKKLPQEILKKYDRMYQIAVESYEKNYYSDLIMIANDLHIDISDIPVLIEILPCLNKKKKEIENYKSQLGWQWYHIPHEKRNEVLKDMLGNMGFNISDEEIKEVLDRKIINRKTGQRPKKINVKRKRLK